MHQERLPCRWNGTVQQVTWRHQVLHKQTCAPLYLCTKCRRSCHSLWYRAVVLKAGSLLQHLIPSLALVRTQQLLNCALGFLSWELEELNPEVCTAFCILWCLRFTGDVAFFSPQWSMGLVLGWFFFLPPAAFIQNCALNYYFVSSRWRFFVSTHVSEYLWMDTNFLIFTIVFKHYLQLIP